MRELLRRALALSALVVLHSTSSYAQSNWSDKAIAKQLLEDAEKLMASGNAAAACPKYDESQRRVPELDTLLKLADCYEKAGKTASAWAAFNEAGELAARKGALGARDPREQIARGRISSLESKLSRLTFTVADPDTAGLELRQDGVLVGRGVWGSAVPIDPGSYNVKATAPGKRPWTQMIEVGPNGARVEVTVPALEDEPVGSATMPPSPPAPASRAPIDASPSAPAPPGNSMWGVQRTMGIALSGVGLVSAGIGVVFGVTSQSKASDRDAICPSGVHCTQQEADHIADLTTQARADATRSWVALSIGATALVGGVALILTAPPLRASGASALRLTPWVGTTSAGASVGGVW
jgi:hypothetical protein